MADRRRLAIFCCILAGWAAFPPVAPAQSSLPSEYSVDDRPLLPAGIGTEPVEIGGTYAYTWQREDTSILSVYGDFVLQMGGYRLKSRDAVVWFRPRMWNDRRYHEYEVFLWNDAEVVQPAGTVETGPALFVTLNSFGDLRLNATGRAEQSDESSPLYQRARTVRGETEGPATQPGDEPLQIKPRRADRIRLGLPQRAPRRIDYSGRSLSSEIVEGQRVVIAIGDVRVSQGGDTSADAMELRADSAVLFLSKAQFDEAMPGMGGGARDETQRTETQEAEPAPTAKDEPTLTGAEKTDRQAARDFVTAAYLEGDVVLTRGTRMIRASQLYYDFEADRALLLDVVMSAIAPGRDVPIYVRAEQVRQLSGSEYVARRAKLTTSEFHTPHIALGSTTAYLTDRTPRNERGEIIGVQAGTYRAYNTTLEMEGVPILYWPFAKGDFSRDTMAFRGAKFGYSSDFGATFETRWYMFNLLGLETPEGYDATLKLDYFTDRGPGVGIDMDYVREDYYGLLRSYYIHDTGEDDLGPIRGGTPDTENRGRVLWRHRQYLPQDWQLTLEAAYISDDNYLESYERNEWENGKEQETLLMLLKRRDNWQFSTLFNWRLMDWLTQTEHFPDAVFSLIGEPLTEWATLYSESRVGVTRFKPDNRRVFDTDRYDNTDRTGSTVRGDTRQEVNFPLPSLGPVKLTPYLMGRASAWDDLPEKSGSEGRIFGSAGARANMYLHRVYDNVESELLDLHRLRYIAKPDVGLWLAGSNVDSNELPPFDQSVETIDDFGGVTLGLRQRWQTKRGGPGRWRTVDWITWDVEAGFFSNARPGDRTHGNFIYSRPEDSISSNFLATTLSYRISDSTILIYEGVIDTSRGNAGTSALSLNIERDPRLAYFFGWRYIHDTDSNLIGFGANYRLSDKHMIAFREYYDIELDRNYSTQVTYIRRWPRWYTAISFDLDEPTDDIGISFSAWPEGAPQLGLGSKRFTGVGDSIGVRP
ncbi:MAG: LPS assembly protein LptD [Phycisphaerae bacterium]|nr:LPS assembly protein LptD [Phycisphaerae bacterium]